MKLFIKYILPGAALILMAFISGSQRNMFFALLGFISFFTVGVMVIIQGIRTRKNHDNESSSE